MPREAVRHAYAVLTENVLTMAVAPGPAATLAFDTLKDAREHWIRERQKMEEAHRLLQQTRYTEYAVGLFALFVAAITCWLVWKYVKPRWDMSLSSDPNVLFGYARDASKDTALRCEALRKLAASDKPGVREGLLQIIQDATAPEVLRFEAQQSLQQQQRRQMRRAFSA
jgi:hypothetical protein